MNDMAAIFVGDAPGLDFLNSLATPQDEPVEWLATGESFLTWMRQAGLVEAAKLDELQKAALPAELDSVAAQARGLREWFRGFVQAHKGAPLPAAAIGELEPLNRILARDEQYDEIAIAPDAGAGNSLVLMRRRRWRSPEALLLPLAEAIAKVITEEDFTQVKHCEGHNCTLVFVDKTRSRRRRWCSMAVCGNRAKQASHRHRTAGH